MAPPPSELIGAAGSRYLLKQLIQERPNLGRVWLAISGQERVIMQEIPRAVFSSFNEDIRPRLPESPYRRLPHDTIPNRQIFVYKYMNDDLLSIARTQMSVRARKQILKASLPGIAELHNHDIVHLDIKSDNVMVNYHGTGPETMMSGFKLWILKTQPTSLTGGTLKGC
ncbi:hypothetical protein VTO42DRAFT_1964 [Malbranchea cinnamomea]